MYSTSDASNSICPAVSSIHSMRPHIDDEDPNKKIIDLINRCLRSQRPIPVDSPKEIGRIVQIVRNNGYLRKKVEMLAVHAFPTPKIITQILKLGNITALSFASTLSTIEDDALTLSTIEDDALVALAEHPSLTSIRFGSHRIGEKGMKALTQNDRIKRLGFCENNFSELEVIFLAQMKRLEVLDVRMNRIGRGALALAGSRTLTNLNLSGCQLEDEAGFALAKNPTLQRLTIQDVYGLENRFSAGVAIAFARSQSLFHLDYGFNQVSKEALLVFGENRTLISLNIAGCSLQNQDAITLSRSLIHNQGSLESLNMSDNELTDNGAMVLSLCSFKELLLGQNEIGDKGAIALAHSERLSSLNLFRNKIGKEGAEALAANTNMTALNLGKNHIGDGIFAFLNNRALTSFDWDFECRNFEDATDPVERLSRIDFNNRTRVLNWIGVAIILASYRANATSPIRDFILPLAKEVQTMAKPEFWE